MNAQNLGGLPSDLKIRNRMLILETMRDGDRYTAQDIAEHTGISRPTVMKSINFFISKGLMIEEGKGDSTEAGGKKPLLYRFVCSRLLLTISLWPELVLLNLSSMDGKKIASVRIEAPVRRTPEEMFALIEEKAGELLASQGGTVDQLYGVSLSTGGIVGYDTGVLKYSSLSPEWGNNIPMGRYLREIFGEQTEIIVENAGKMAGRAEMLREDVENKRIMVLFSTWGLSACLIEKGHVLNGGHSLIGEIGHMVIDSHDHELCGCGSYGCAERMLSKARIREMIREAGEDCRSSSLHQYPLAEMTPEMVFRCAQEGDPLAQRIESRLAEIFAALLRNASLVFDPDVIVFQGEYAYAGPSFIGKLKHNLRQFAYYPAEGAVEIKCDTRKLEELDYIGATFFLQHRFLADKRLYQ